MTEEEAKMKWCPNVRLVADPQLYTNRGRTPEKAAAFMCLASECMAWRWTWTTDSLFVSFEGIPPEPVFRKYDKEHLHGYCGLAGKP
jgi:hypothetical protein